MRLVCLDFDGVLNDGTMIGGEVNCGTFRPENVFYLNALLQHADAQFVVTSSWRYLVYRGEMNEVGLRWLLRSHGIMDRMHGIIGRDVKDRDRDWDGKTPWEHCDSRGMLIAEYLRDKVGLANLTSYVVLDDCDLGITEAKHPFVHCTASRGFTSAEYIQAMAAFGLVGACNPSDRPLDQGVVHASG